jgi:hypothetical protein
MGDAYFPTNHHTSLPMTTLPRRCLQKNRNDNKPIWGALQVVHLKWECTGTAAEAEVGVGQIDVFGAFSQESSNPTPPHLALQVEASQALRT